MAHVFIDLRDLETAVAAREAVEADGHEVEMIETADEIESRLDGRDRTALILTGDLGDGTSRAMIGLFSSRIPRPPVLGFAAGATQEEGRRIAASSGLDAVLSLPADPEEIRVVLDQELDRYEIQLTTGIVGRSDAIREALERIHTIAQVNTTVLITGESGTGKELVARALHQLSPRRAKPFIAVNCAALPESLLESELFGHEKGAFTGATSLRRGMFELADGGTMLLDEIAEMPLATQTRLLRVLESRRFMRVGGDREIEVNVRVIAATNRGLAEAVDHGVFRRDLFYRLNVINIDLPPLRERKEDIPILVQRFIGEFSRSHDREFKGLAPETLRILLDFDWPGNVRELRNLIESMVVLAPGSVIQPDDIPTEIRSGGRAATLTLPATLPVAESADAIALPQMEFIFRTLVELKLDVEDLRREFERYKDRHPELLSAGALPEMIELPDRLAVEDVPVAGADAAVDGEPEGEEVQFVIPPGMTMADLEREAIIAMLRETGGNRRKAAERLQIGERTLYRKLKEYDIEL